ncbi:MAG: ATP-binding protein [Candidatus Auribacterota bacterium]
MTFLCDFFIALSFAVCNIEITLIRNPVDTMKKHLLVYPLAVFVFSSTLLVLLALYAAKSGLNSLYFVSISALIICMGSILLARIAGRLFVSLRRRQAAEQSLFETLSSLLQIQAGEFASHEEMCEAMRSSVRQHEKNCEELRVIFDSIQEAVISIDRQGMVSSMNMTAEKLIGFKLNELAGKCVDNILKIKDVHTQNAESVPWDEIIAAGMRFEMVSAQMTDRFGNEKYISINAFPVYEPDNSISGAACVIHDVTETYFTSLQLHKREDFIEDVFASVQEGISVLNRELDILFTNNMMKRWYPETLPHEGKKCYLCYHNADVPCRNCPSVRCIKTGRTESSIVPGLPGSMETWFELFSYPVKDRQTGQITGVVEFVRNITDRVKQQHERENMIKMLTIQNEDLENIVYLSHHTIRAPLVTIEGFTRIIRQSLNEICERAEQSGLQDEDKQLSAALNENIPFMLGRINNACLTIGGLLDGIRTLVALRSVALNITPVDMHEVITEIIKDKQELIRQCSAEIEVKALCTCKADKQLAAQALSHIIDNALLFRKCDAKPVITVSCESSDHTAVLCIEDNGIGFDQSYADKVFSVFYKLDQDSPGRGLGLTIAKRIVYLLNGTIRVESKKGTGSRFFISLPMP